MVSRLPKIMLIQFVQTNQSDRGVTDLLPYSLKSQLNTRVLFAKKKKKKINKKLMTSTNGCVKSPVAKLSAFTNN